jgi:hypothetical protein
MKIIHLDGYSATIKPCDVARDIIADFEIFECTGFVADKEGKFTVRLYSDDEDMSGGVEDIGKAVPVVVGHVKWDGCANIDFKTDTCMAHFCGYDDVERFTKALLETYKAAALSIPRRDPDMQRLPK